MALPNRNGPNLDTLTNLMERKARARYEVYAPLALSVARGKKLTTKQAEQLNELMRDLGISIPELEADIATINNIMALIARRDRKCANLSAMQAELEPMGPQIKAMKQDLDEFIKHRNHLTKLVDMAISTGREVDRALAALRTDPRLAMLDTNEILGTKESE